MAEENKDEWMTKQHFMEASPKADSILVPFKWIVKGKDGIPRKINDWVIVTKDELLHAFGNSEMDQDENITHIRASFQDGVEEDGVLFID